MKLTKQQINFLAEEAAVEIEKQISTEYNLRLSNFKADGLDKQAKEICKELKILEDELNNLGKGYDITIDRTYSSNSYRCDNKKERPYRLQSTIEKELERKVIQSQLDGESLNIDEIVAQLIKKFSK